jgi:hypothetical protein
MRPFSTSILPSHNPVAALYLASECTIAFWMRFEHRALVERSHFLSHRHHDICRSSTDDGIVDRAQIQHSSRYRSEPTLRLDMSIVDGVNEHHSPSLPTMQQPLLIW